MAPKTKLRKHVEPIVPAGGIHPVIEEYLLTGRVPDDAPAEVRDIEFQPDRAETLWKQHRRALLAEAKRRRFVPYAATLFDATVPGGLPVWRDHRPDALPVLGEGGKVRPCRHCGSSDLGPATCLAR